MEGIDDKRIQKILLQMDRAAWYQCKYLAAMLIDKAFYKLISERGRR